MLNAHVGAIDHSWNEIIDRFIPSFQKRCWGKKSKMKPTRGGEYYFFLCVNKKIRENFLFFFSSVV